MPNKQEMSTAYDRFLKAKKARDGAWDSLQLARANFEEVERAFEAADHELRGARLTLANIGLSIGIVPVGGPTAA